MALPSTTSRTFVGRPQSRRSTPQAGSHDYDFYVGPANITRGDVLPSLTHCYQDMDGLKLAATDGQNTMAIQNDYSSDPEPEFESFDNSMTRDCAQIEGRPGSAHQMPYSDDYLGLGTIRVYDCSDSSCGFKGCSGTHMKGSVNDDIYPNMLVKAGLNKKWLRMDGLSIGTKAETTSLRVYVLPEDVARSSRGSVKDFRKMVKYLLPFIDCSSDAWLGRTDGMASLHCYQEPCTDVEESLFYMFNTIKSPAPDTSIYAGPEHGLRAMVDTLQGEITGMKTELYSYQKRSVAAMIKKEQDPARIRDPRKQRFFDVFGKSFYLDMNDGSLYGQQPLYYEPKGGILAETMGYGKTLICIALVLATRGHYPSIPTHCVEATHTEQYESTPSLLSMAARKLKHQGLPWKNEFYRWKKSGYHYDSCEEELQKYVRSYDEPVAGSLNPSRKGKHEHTNTVQLCSATLIIVPPNLIIQWQQEISKHVDEEAVDVLVIAATSDKVPDWQELIKYDIVLISKSRFEQEYRDDDFNQGKGIRYAEKYKSPLTEVRWLRVICDEGHGFAGSATRTNAMAMLDKMFIERRWVVSGTPASGLHGVEVGLRSLESTSRSPETTRRESFGSALNLRKVPQAPAKEVKDLERLRLIVCNFLKLQPWANKKGDDQADWMTYLAPRIGSNGKRYSMPALREIMQTLIVRHRIQDVDCDLTLPPLHNTITYLDPSYYDKLSINLFVMILISNYVTSEREDEDYMFHSKNRGKLTTLINNLGHATFYWIGISAQNVLDTIEVSEKYLDKHIDTVSDKDGMLVTEAIMNGKRALQDSGWQAFNQLHEMGTYVKAFPSHAQMDWALDGSSVDPLLLGTTQAREVQKHVQARIQKDIDDPLRMLAQHGKRTMQIARQRAEDEQMQMQKNKINIDQKEAGTVEGPSKRAPSSSTSPAKDSARSLSAATSNKSTVDTPTNIALPDTSIIGFVSAKLTYLCSKILSHPEEKTIVFYNHNNTAFFIAEALELLRVPFLIYANTLSVPKRAEYLAKFNMDIETRVLLMDLKHAALGLHVAAASRVYIVSPIWDPALESQAIKRAHRIGQTRKVYVETLVLKGTFEEALIRRRREKADQRSQSGDPPSTGNEGKPLTIDDESSKKDKGKMLDDTVMIRVLKDITFLKILDDEEKLVRLSRPVPLFHTATTKATKYEDRVEIAVDAPELDDDGLPIPATSTHFSIFGTHRDTNDSVVSSSGVKRALSGQNPAGKQDGKRFRFGN